MRGVESRPSRRSAATRFLCYPNGRSTPDGFRAASWLQGQHDGRARREFSPATAAPTSLGAGCGTTPDWIAAHRPGSRRRFRRAPGFRLPPIGHLQRHGDLGRPPQTTSSCPATDQQSRVPLERSKAPRLDRAAIFEPATAPLAPLDRGSEGGRPTLVTSHGRGPDATASRPMTRFLTPGFGRIPAMPRVFPIMVDSAK